MPKEADVPPQQGKPEKGTGEKNDEKKVEPFHLREKIEEMVDYGYPLTMSFPRKDRELADELKKSILTIYRLSIEIDRKYFKKTTTQNLDVELDVLRGMVRLAASKKLHGGQVPAAAYDAPIRGVGQIQRGNRQTAGRLHQDAISGLPIFIHGNVLYSASESGRQLEQWRQRWPVQLEPQQFPRGFELEHRGPFRFTPRHIMCGDTTLDMGAMIYGS